MKVIAYNKQYQVVGYDLLNRSVLSFSVKGWLDVACFARSIGGKAGAVHPCRNCHGTGVKVSYRQLGPGMVQQMQGVCSDCHGEGITYFCFRIDIYV